MADLYSADEAAKILGLQVRTVRNYVREGRLPGVRIGKQYRIARADLEAFTAGSAPPDDAQPRQATHKQPAQLAPPAAEASSVVQVDGILAASAERLERTLTAAALAGSGQGGPQPRVEPIYDEERQRLRLIMVGPPAEIADLLRIVDSFTRERGSPGAFGGT